MTRLVHVVAAQPLHEGPFPHHANHERASSASPREYAGGVAWRIVLVWCLVATAWGAHSVARAQTDDTGSSTTVDDASVDPADVAEREAIQHEREVMWGLFAAGGTLLTAGGFGTFGYAFPGAGFVAVLSCGAAGLVGLVLFLVAVGMDTGLHARTDALRARAPTLRAGPGELGLGMAIAF